MPTGFDQLEPLEAKVAHVNGSPTSAVVNQLPQTIEENTLGEI